MNISSWSFRLIRLLYAVPRSSGLRYYVFNCVMLSLFGLGCFGLFCPFVFQFEGCCWFSVVVGVLTSFHLFLGCVKLFQLFALFWPHRLLKLLRF